MSRTTPYDQDVENSYLEEGDAAAKQHNEHRLELEMDARKKVANRMEAFWAAEKELKAAMPTLFSPLDRERLEKAVMEAKANDVHVADPPIVARAEAVLREHYRKNSKNPTFKDQVTGEEKKPDKPFAFPKVELPGLPGFAKSSAPRAQENGVAPLPTKEGAEDELASAMPSMFQEAVYPDRLTAAIEAAKATGVDSAKIAAAEDALKKALEHKDTELKHSEYEAQMATVRAEEKARRKAEAEEKAKIQAAKGKIKDAEEALKAALPNMFSPAYPERLEEAIATAKEAGVSALQIEVAEAALQEAKDHVRMEESKKARAAAEARLAAEEKAQAKAKAEEEAADKAKAKADLAARDEAIDELKAAMPTLFSPAYPARLMDAIEVAKQTGVPESQGGPQLVAEAEAALRETLHRMPKADIEADKLQHAEKKLKSAMTTLPFQSVNPDKLRHAIEDAKAAGVSADKIEAAESMLSKLTPKAAESPKKIGGLNGQMASKASSVDPKIKEAEKHLKKAMPTYFSKTDLEQLEQAIDYAKTIEGVDPAKIAAAEAALVSAKAKEAGANAATGAMDGAGKAMGGAINLGSTVTSSSDPSVTTLTFSGATSEEVTDAEAQLRTAFDKFDRNHSGKMDHKELKKALATVGMEMDADQAKELLAKYDKDGSGLMEFEEFKMLCIALNAVNLNFTPVKTLDEKTQREAEVGRQRSNLGTGRQESGSQEASIDRCC